MQPPPATASGDLLECPPDDPRWGGRFEPFTVGDPGRAPSRVVSRADPRYWDRQDTVLDGVTVHDPDGRPAAVLRAASVRGLAHRHYGTVRQDEYAFRVTPDGRHLVVCVADGVSDGDYSHLAALWATHGGVEDLCRILADTPPEDLDWARFIGGVAGIIERSGRSYLLDRGLAPSAVASTRQVAGQLASTVLYAVVDLTDPDVRPVHLCGLGDTSAWVLHDGSWQAQQPIKNDGEEIYSSSVTALPLLSAAPPAVMHTEVGPEDVLVLMTDGVGDALADGIGPVGDFLAEQWTVPPTNLEFAAQVDFHRNTFDDDRTVVAIWPLPPD